MALEPFTETDSRAVEQSHGRVHEQSDCRLPEAPRAPRTPPAACRLVPCPGAQTPVQFNESHSQTVRHPQCVFDSQAPCCNSSWTTANTAANHVSLEGNANASCGWTPEHQHLVAKTKQSFSKWRRERLIGRAMEEHHGQLRGGCGFPRTLSCHQHSNEP